MRSILVRRTWEYDPARSTSSRFRRGWRLGKVGSTAPEILANIHAVEFAIDHATSSSAVTLNDVLRIHAGLIVTVANAHVAGAERVTSYC
jgi:hypothetical protein